MKAGSSQKIRLTYLVGQLGYGGSERQLYTLLRHLDPEHYHCSVIVFNPSPHRVFDRPLEEHGVKICHVPGDHTSIFSRMRYVYGQLKNLSPDVVHSWSAHDNAYAGILGRLAGVPLRLGSLRGSLYLSGFQNLPAFYRWLSLYSVSALTVNADSIARELESAGYPPERLKHIPNCIDPASTQSIPDLSAYGIEDQHRVVGIVGNLRRVKNQSMFVSGLAKVLPKFADVRGVIVGQSIPGENELPSQLIELINDTGVHGKIRMLGFRSDVPQLMRRFSIFCLTSNLEGTPNVILEAMAASRPVIATRVGGVPYVVQEGVTGILVDPGDTTGLVCALTQLLDDPALAYQMGQTGRQFVEEHYNCRSAVKTLTELYESALNP